MEVALERVTRRFREPLRTAFGTLRERELIVLRLRGADGVEGVGEAAPLEPYDGVSIDATWGALEDCRALLHDGDGGVGRGEREALLAACERVAVLPQALAAIDLALRDLAGRRAGSPVWRMLGAAAGGAVEVNATIGAEDRAGAAREAGAARAAGFRCVKVKVGVGDDAGRVAAVRAAAGPHMAIRLDANGAWSVPEAEVNLRALAPCGIELCEEPVHGADALRALRARTDVPLAADETRDALGAVEAVCLKVARCGGIGGVVEQAAAARLAGAEVYLASSFDGPLGIAAALHAAAVVRPERPCGLATLGLFEEAAEPMLTPRAGRMAVPTGPGLLS